MRFRGDLLTLIQHVMATMPSVSQVLILLKLKNYLDENVKNNYFITMD